MILSTASQPQPVSSPVALLFDLDGTLVESERDIAAALNVALCAMGRQPLAVEVVLPMIGDGARVLIERALGPLGRHPDAAGATSPELLDRTLALFQEAYAANPCVHSLLLSGAKEALAIDRPRALFTNKPRALTLLVLEGLGILERFQAIYAGGDGPLKPSPDGVKALAATLGVEAALLNRVWMIGDGPQDVLAGRAAGCVTVAVPSAITRDRVLEAKPDVVVESLFDVVRLFEEVSGQHCDE